MSYCREHETARPCVWCDRRILQAELERERRRVYLAASAVREMCANLCSTTCTEGCEKAIDSLDVAKAIAEVVK